MKSILIAILCFFAAILCIGAFGGSLLTTRVEPLMDAYSFSIEEQAKTTRELAPYEFARETAVTVLIILVITVLAARLVDGWLAERRAKRDRELRLLLEAERKFLVAAGHADNAARQLPAASMHKPTRIDAYQNVSR